MVPISRDVVKDLKVHGIHQGNKKLFFETKVAEDSGKLMIAVPRTKTSKFGPPPSQKTQEHYRLVKLSDKELEKAMSEQTKLELKSIQGICKEKEKVKADVYFEDIYTFPIELRCKKDRDYQKKRKMNIGQKLQDERQ